MTDSPRTVSVSVVAESLASVHDDSQGFSPTVADQVVTRLNAIVKSLNETPGREHIYGTRMSIADARLVQDTYISHLKSGAYGEELAAAWLAAESERSYR